MINRLGLPLFILGIALVAVSFLKTPQSTSVKSVKDIQNKTPVATKSSSLTFTVTKVVDGDTIDVKINGREEKIRLIGINAPESGDCFGKEATDKAKELLGSKSVELEADPTQDERDKYHRLLRYVFVQDLNFEELMVREGFAKEYTYNKPYKYQALFKSAQGEAQNNKRGLWADGACDDNSKVKTQNSKLVPSSSRSAQSSYVCDCSKLCSQISTCDEAYFQLNNCGCSKRDSDHDGIPCESLCK